jgi:predicted DNA-binding transcriptional regulator YafY
MSQLERIYKLDRMLRRKKAPSKNDILLEFEISPAQFKRDLDFLRDRLGAPAVYDMRAGGYKYQEEGFDLPGLWFSEREVYSLLLMHSLLEQLQPGFVREQLGPFEQRLRALLGKSGCRKESILARMRVCSAPLRRFQPEHFQIICDAMLRRKRVKIRYYSRSRDVESDRVVSPQRLMYYRGNWYMDAWCHDKDAGRRFAIDAVRVASALNEAAVDVPGVSSAEGYGIFAGPAENVAVLDFDPVAARWVAEEEWHPAQRTSPLPDGGLRVEVPYSNHQEILMDILRHGARVEVVAPPALRRAVGEAHREAAEKYAPRKRVAASAAASVAGGAGRGR